MLARLLASALDHHEIQFKFVKILVVRIETWWKEGNIPKPVSPE